MIEMEIKLYPEPQSIYSGGTGVRTRYHTKEEEEKCAGALVSARALFNIGDRVQLATGRATITITGFNEDPKEMRLYRDNPCPIKGTNFAWQNPTAIDYSLEELDLTTIEKVKTKDINTEAAND